MTRLALAAGALCLAACGRGYSNFTLPLLAGGDPNLRFELRLNADPVISPSVASDSHDALNPSVIRQTALYNYFSGFDGATWHTLLATSGDGITWRVNGPVLSPDQPWEAHYIAANGSALPGHYWYVAGPRNAGEIGLAQWSGDGPATKLAAPVLRHGPFESWDERAVADPYVLRVGASFFMYYLGQDRAIPTRQRLGLARSTDGLHWQKLIANPILDAGKAGDFDEAAVGEPAVFRFHDFYWMLYTGNKFNEERSIGLARSTDGVHWTKLPLPIAGRAPWNSKVLCDPTVLVEGESIRVWFGGGDVASPDENLHGQIGYAVLTALQR